MEVAERQAWLNITKGSHMIVETLPGWVRRVGGLVSSAAVILRGPLGFCLLDCRMRRGSLCFFSWLHSEILGHVGQKAVQRGELGQGRAARKDLLNDGDAEWSLKGRMSTSERREHYMFILNEWSEMYAKTYLDKENNGGRFFEKPKVCEQTETTGCQDYWKAESSTG